MTDSKLSPHELSHVLDELYSYQLDQDTWLTLEDIWYEMDEKGYTAEQITQTLYAWLDVTNDEALRDRSAAIPEMTYTVADNE